MGESDNPPPGQKKLTGLERFQASVAIFVSLATAFIAWESFKLNDQAEANNAQLKQIENQLSEQRFGFERIRDIYDRTEKYLASEQDERRGRALVVLISSLPKNQLRADLLKIVTTESTHGSVSIAAADSYIGGALPDATTSDLEFVGQLRLQLQEDGRAIVREQFGFKDSTGTVWTVPAGAVVGRSSIPRFAWSAIGSPFEGEYQKASVLYDYHATQRSHSYRDVGRMFYEALIASGVSDLKAMVLYSVVYGGGARW